MLRRDGRHARGAFHRHGQLRARFRAGKAILAGIVGLEILRRHVIVEGDRKTHRVILRIGDVSARPTAGKHLGVKRKHLVEQIGIALTALGVGILRYGLRRLSGLLLRVARLRRRLLHIVRLHRRRRRDGQKRAALRGRSGRQYLHHLLRRHGLLRRHRRRRGCGCLRDAEIVRGKAEIVSNLLKHIHRGRRRGGRFGGWASASPAAWPLP